MKETFISESIKPCPGAFTTSALVSGAPGVPQSFVWRQTTYDVAAVLETWKETGPCSHGSHEVYVRKHGYRIITADGTKMTIYFERQARSSRQKKARWWLYSIGKEE